MMIISTNIVNTNNDIHADNSNNYTISIIIIVIIIISIDNIIMDHIGRARARFDRIHRFVHLAAGMARLAMSTNSPSFGNSQNR